MGYVTPFACNSRQGTASRGQEANQGQVHWWWPVLFLGAWGKNEFWPGIHSWEKKDFLHVLQEVLGQGTADEVEFIVEFNSRLACHSSCQAGTELLNHSILHVLYIQMTPQFKFQLMITKTRPFEGLSYWSNSLCTSNTANLWHRELWHYTSSTHKRFPPGAEPDELINQIQLDGTFRGP
jgi:hypothetical protein